MLRGEIWLVDLNPVIGSEISKQRPVVIISSDDIGVLPIKLVAPVTGWQSSFEGKPWLVKILPDNQNNLSKTSAIDVLQLRGIDTLRFVKRIGKVSSQKIKEITFAIAVTIEFEN